MQSAPSRPDETNRLAAVKSYEILDTASEDAFNDLVDLAARLTSSPIALVSLADTERLWFKARHGLDSPSVPRDLGMCNYTISNPRDALVVGDMTRDERFADNPLVTGVPGLRAYLGMPLVDTDGYALGSLCVIDRVPRCFELQEVDTVRTLARAVVVNLELRRSLLRTSRAAVTDSLTGLPNRRAIMAALSEAAAGGASAAVIAVDLDHFKETNDGEGHAAGDALLQAVAERLRSAVRPEDAVGRVGGDEFIVVLRDMSDRRAVELVAQRISVALSSPVEYGARLLRLGATLGVALIPEHSPDAELAMRLADDALLRAKREGRGGVAFAQADDAALLLRTAAIIRAFDEADAMKALAVQGATVLLQPIVALGPLSATVPSLAALEALARWTHPDVGMISPAELFPLIGPARAARLGEAVRELALAAFAELCRMGLANVRLALNLSAAEVFRADIALHIAEQVERAGLSLRSIEIEITEEVLLDRVSDRTLDQLAALRGRGARLVLDDFGTGNSGLAQLLRLPLDGVKLDKQFVQRLGTDPRAGEIVRATVSLAQSLRMAVVAEGVESDSQVAMLRALGCDAAQGYLFARPMTAEEVQRRYLTRLPEAEPAVVTLRPRATHGA